MREKEEDRFRAGGREPEVALADFCGGRSFPVFLEK